MGVSNLNQDDLWMYADLHNPDKGRLRNERATENGTPHHSLEFDPETCRRGQAVNENTHFYAVKSEPHKPTRRMVPAGRLQNHSRDLFLGIKTNTHSSSGNIVASSLDMDLSAVQRGLQSAKRAPRYHMPLPNEKQRRDHLYSKLDTRPSLHGSQRLLRESSVFSSAYSASDHTDTTQSPVALPPAVSANNWDSAILPQTVSPTASHPRQQAPVLAMDESRKDIRSKGKKVNTTSVDRVGRSSHADTNPQCGYIINQRWIMAQNVQKQHNGTALNLSNFNAQEQNQTFNLTHNAPSLTPSADEKHLGGCGTRRDQSDRAVSDRGRRC
ncbi:hypothetical protein AG0111_0g2062 [Alternaria gaisen]|uniref:Uncharacterized protein n=1 Tax=Alternaria gaisen TaxID=167740 RepID=A0ACB6FZX3_9PLEO|nr:hypothetical protein AG0111_0g2062 [Alternaria gaisen]